jgi:hypothetical protein
MHPHFLLMYVLFSSGNDANSRSHSVSGPMQDPGSIHAITVAQTTHDRQDVGSQSPDESNQDEDEDESESGHKILSQTLGKVGHQAKGKVADPDVSSLGGKKQQRSHWVIPNKANINFCINVQELITKLKCGQLLTADEVYSAPEWHGFEKDHPK